LIQSNVRRLRSRAGAVRACIAACVLSTLLAACGGGGGGSPGPTVAVQASATSTYASGASITLSATVQNSTATGTPTWSLSGPGSLSATSGATVTYVPPDSEADANDGAATATITASVAGISGQTQIMLTAKAFPGHHWTVASAPIGGWEALAYANGLFVAGGSNGVISTSPDGITWTRRDSGAGEEWSSIIYTPTGWWLLDTTHGTLRGSADGVTWASKPMPAAANGLQISRLAYANGIYVMLGYSGGTLASTNGTTWTTSSVTGNAITYGNGVFVISGSDGVFWSADGVAWTKTTVPSTQDELGFSNGKFLAVGSTEVYTSTDGKTWASVGAPSTYLDDDTTFVSIDNTLYGVGVLGLYTSTDDVNWTTVSTPLDGMIGLAQGGGKVVGVSSYGGIATGPDVAHLSTVVESTKGMLGSGLYAHGRYLWTTPTGIRSSSDGTTWSSTDFAPGNGMAFTRSIIDSTCNGMALGPDGTIVVSGRLNPVTGPGSPNASAFAWSSDGIAWNFSQPQGTTPTSDFDPGPVIHDGTQFLSIGARTGYIHTSPDGHTWTNAGRFMLPSGTSVASLAHANGKYVLVGGGGLTATSPDGLTWTVGAKVASPGVTASLLDATCMVWTGTQFVAAGLDAVAATSPDGVTWTAHATSAPASTSEGGSEQINGMAVDASGEIVAVGNDGLIETSRDGVHWTLRHTPGQEQFTGVALIPTGFMAGAGSEAVLFSSN